MGKTALVDDLIQKQAKRPRLELKLVGNGAYNEILYDDANTCDLTIVVHAGPKFKSDGNFQEKLPSIDSSSSTLIHAHSLILTAKNSFFDRLLSDELNSIASNHHSLTEEISIETQRKASDGQRGASTVIQLWNTCPTRFRTLLKSLYTNKLECGSPSATLMSHKVDFSQIQEYITLKGLADRFDFSGAGSEILQIIEDFLTKDNFLKVYKEACEQAQSQVTDLIANFLQVNANEILGGNENSVLGYPLEILQTLLSSRSVTLPEIRLVELAKFWVARNKPTEKEKENLVTLIRFDKLTSGQISDLIKTGFLTHVPATSKCSLHELIAKSSDHSDLLARVTSPDGRGNFVIDIPGIVDFVPGTDGYKSRGFSVNGTIFALEAKRASVRCNSPGLSSDLNRSNGSTASSGSTSSPSETDDDYLTLVLTCEGSLVARDAQCDAKFVFSILGRERVFRAPFKPVNYFDRPFPFVYCPQNSKNINVSLRTQSPPAPLAALGVSTCNASNATVVNANHRFRGAIKAKQMPWHELVNAANGCVQHGAIQVLVSIDLVQIY